MIKRLVVFCLSVLFVFSLVGCSDAADKNDVDIDLSGLSMTMMQAEYQRILSNPRDFIGKTIRAIGLYRTMIIDDAGNYTHSIIIVPGDECCLLGFEFQPDGDIGFPDDYPAQDARIKITGTIDEYNRSGALYLYIAVDSFEVMSD